MTTPATGDLALLLENLEILIASSATFQTAVGATGEASAKLAAARLRVHWPATLDVENLPRPWAWIRLKNPQTWSNPGGPGSFVPALSLDVLLEIEDSVNDEPKERQVKALNCFEGIIKDMAALAGTAGYLAVTELTLEEFTMSDPNEAKRYSQALLGVKVW